MTRFVALKFTTARPSNSTADPELSLHRRLSSNSASSSVPATSNCFPRLLNSFEVNGPNGLHTVFVFEPLGPHVADVLFATPSFNHGTLLSGNGTPLVGILEYQRFPKYLGKRILRNVLQGLPYLHAHGVVHADLHMGNILVTTRADLECNAVTIAELQQKPEDGKHLKRLDGKQDLWASPHVLPPAGLIEYSSTELDPYVKIADTGGSFLADEPPPAGKIATPSEVRAPEILLGFPAPLGTGIDIWSFGCLAFLITTGHTSGHLIGSEETTKETKLIQFSEVIGPLPEAMFNAWERGATYFAQDRKSRRAEILADGEDGTWDFMSMDHSDSESQSEQEGSDEADGVRALPRQGDVPQVGQEDEHEDDAKRFDFLDLYHFDSTATSEEEPLIKMAFCRSLEQRFSDLKPEDMNEVEEQQVVHLLRRIFQYDPAMRPTVEELLDHPRLKTGREEAGLQRF